VPFDNLWARIVGQMVESAGFVEVVFNSGDADRFVGLEHRLRWLLGGPLAQAHADKTVDATLTLDDLMLVLRMIFGAIHVEGGVIERQCAARQALSLIGRGLAVAQKPTTHKGNEQ
jgi:hypothetical protein